MLLCLSQLYFQDPYLIKNVQSECYEYMSRKIAQGHLKAGDAMMADKGLTTDKEMEDLGLGLNIPPFTSPVAQRG